MFLITFFFLTVNYQNDMNLSKIYLNLFCQLQN